MHGYTLIYFLHPHVLLHNTDSNTSLLFKPIKIVFGDKEPPWKRVNYIKKITFILFLYKNMRQNISSWRK